MTHICECGHEDRDHISEQVQEIEDDGSEVYVTRTACDDLECRCVAFIESVDLTAEADQQLRREQQDQA